jgi:hypothetical protein
MIRHARSPCCTLVLAAGVALVSVAAPGVAADVDDWVAQLAAPQYARRESAARSLVATGTAILPTLERAIRAGDLEVASRGIEVVADILASTDDAAAEQCLRLLAADGEGALAALAADALTFHMLAVTTAARGRLESLGALVRERSPVDGGGLDVDLDAGWRGGANEFRDLARLRGLVGVSVRGVPVDAGMIDLLGTLSGVQRIDLYGTGAGPSEARMLADRLPDARIDVRRGGRLGVTSTALAGPCEIRTVEPGSAADQAGLRSGDVVQSIGGTAVASFDDLTARLEEHAPGEAVQVVVARRGGRADDEPERIECMVRLDAW